MLPDIVDAQIHIQSDTGGVLAAMSSVGIGAALLDEFWGYDEQGRTLPCAILKNGAFRPLSPNAQSAALLHASQLAWIQRVERRDPHIHSLIPVLSDSPGCKGLRIDLRAEGELAEFLGTGYDALLLQAQEYGLPISVLSRGPCDALAPIAARFPRVEFLLDHCGFPKNESDWKNVLALASYDNVWLKWCLAERTFNDTAFPFPNSQAHLRQAVAAFGAQRIVWASNLTVARNANLAQLLQYVLEADGISASDKEWIVGRSARALYSWEANATSGQHAPFSTSNQQVTR